MMNEIYGYTTDVDGRFEYIQPLVYLLNEDATSKIDLNQALQNGAQNRNLLDLQINQKYNQIKKASETQNLTAGDIVGGFRIPNEIQQAIGMSSPFSGAMGMLPQVGPLANMGIQALNAIPAPGKKQFQKTLKKFRF